MRKFREHFVEWLTAESAEQASLPELLNAYCQHLNDAGFAIRRCSLATEIVHPLMRSMRHVWHDKVIELPKVSSAVMTERRDYRIGKALIEEAYFSAGGNRTPQYLASPFYQIELHGELYEAIHPAGKTQRFPLFEDLARLGCTAYYGLRLKSSVNLLQTISMATERNGGLTRRMREDLGWSLRLLALQIAALVERMIKETLARVYVGQDPGRRVCAGMISVGDVVSMDAAIWFSDIRGFTRISEALGTDELLETLNTYYDALVGAIYDHGGEVLKYIGDAVLAVFPVEQHGSRKAACMAALEAAAACNAGRQEASAASQALSHGIGLHVGEVSYGNIGSSERLDFTVIGPAVNLASRIEGMCKQVDASLICSRAFASEAGIPARSLGAFELKGVPGSVELMVPETKMPSAPVAAADGAF